MIYHYEIPVIASTYTKTYLAEITGPDPKYLMKRKFLQRSIKEGGGLRRCSYNIGGHGVFEQSIKRFSHITKKPISYERKWFVYYRRKFYEIDCNEVLFCCFNLKAQYWRWPDIPKVDKKIQEVA